MRTHLASDLFKPLHRCRRAATLLALLASVSLLSACASAPRSGSNEASAVGSLDAQLQPVKQSRHVQIFAAVQRDALRAAHSVALPRVRLSASAEVGSTSEAQQALLSNAVARSACLELSKRFVLQPPGQTADVQLDIQLTAIRTSSAAASGLSALVGLVVPGPSRLPLGLGGLAARADAVDAQGQALLSYRWARGARSVAEDASMSRIGDAWQLAQRLGRDVGLELAAMREPKPERRPLLPKEERQAGRDLCRAHFGSTPLLGRGLGKLLPLSPEAMDSGAPARESRCARSPDGQQPRCLPKPRESRGVKQ
jgi:hypothetical protein